MSKWTLALALAACALVVAHAQEPCDPNAEPEPPYIEVVLVRNDAGNRAAQVQKAFTDAAAKWSKAIKTNLPDVTLQNNVDLSNRCGMQGAVLPAGKTVFNVVIFAEVRNIDGRGSILGQAGACVFNRVNGNLFPRAGAMTFDAADVENLIDNDTFDGTVLHEMGHVLGIGNNQWRSFLRNNNNPRYVGANGLRGFAAIGGSGQLDVEDVGGGGTRLAHWRTSTFGNELMTGFLSGREQPMSVMTIASLADLGYDVDEAAADSFQVGQGRRLGAEDEHEHEHRHLQEDDGKVWERSTWPDITEEATMLGPLGTYQASTSDLPRNAVLGDEESGGASGGAVAGAAVGGAAAALVAVGAAVAVQRRRASAREAEASEPKGAPTAPAMSVGTMNPYHQRSAVAPGYGGYGYSR